MKLDYTWQQTVILCALFTLAGILVYADKLHADAMITLVVGVLTASPLRSDKPNPKVLTPSKRPPPMNPQS